MENNIKVDKRPINKRLVRYGLQQRLNLFLGTFFTFLYIVLDIVGPLIIANILNNLLLEGKGIKDLRLFIFLIIGYFVCNLVATFARYYTRIFYEKAANSIELLIRKDVFEHVQQLPISYFDNLPAGKVVSRVTNDTKAVKSLFQIMLSDILSTLAFIVGLYIAILFVDVKFGLAFALVVPIIYFIIFDFSKKSSIFTRKVRSHISELNANLNENIQGMEIIQAFGQEDKILEDFEVISNDIYKQELNFTKLYSYSAFNATSSVQYVVTGIIILYFGYGYLTDAYAVSIGALYLLIDYVTKIFNYSNNMVHRLGQLETSYSAADHIFQLLEVDKVENRSKTVGKIAGDVEFDHVSFYYKDEEYVLKDISLKANRGEVIAFVGHTGSGKSTIINLLLDFYEPQRGRILVDGYDISTVDQVSLRKNIAIVLQDPVLFTGTILDNITLNDPSISKDQAIQALIDVGGQIILNNHKDGIMTKVSENGSTFSAGERQLISFARALAKNPPILILDEATSNIDSETETIIQKGIEALKVGRTTFIIAHRLSTINNANNIIVLDKGVVVEQGNHNQLIEHNGVYKKLYQMQSKSKR